MMFGVVLWSDTVKKQAVIWCDDHGDLAFYNSPERGREFMAFRAGDLVEFQLEDSGALRIASCPKVIAKESYPTLTRDLRRCLGRRLHNLFKRAIALCVDLLLFFCELRPNSRISLK